MEDRFWSSKARAALKALVVPLIAVAAACSDGEESATGIAFTHDPGPGDDPLVGHFVVCKLGTPATFNVTVDGVTNQLSLPAGDCDIVARVSSSLPNQRAVVSVEEIVAPGTQLVDVSVRMCDGLVCTTSAGVNPTVDRTLTNDNGWEITFTNEFVSRGGEGCTPGYWKQSQHFDSYPPGFAPSTPFIGATTGFSYSPNLKNPESGNASSLSLLAALSLNGGQQNALIRHAAAAILNANSAGVSYDYSPSEVQGLYNVAKDKNALEAANEQGCPLN